MLIDYSNKINIIIWSASIFFWFVIIAIFFPKVSLIAVSMGFPIGFFISYGMRQIPQLSN